MYDVLFSIQLIYISETLFGIFMDTFESGINLMCFVNRWFLSAMLFCLVYQRKSPELCCAQCLMISFTWFFMRVSRKVQITILC